jgi:hypothetical protein
MTKLHKAEEMKLKMKNMKGLKWVLEAGGPTHESLHSSMLPISCMIEILLAILCLCMENDYFKNG